MKVSTKIINYINFCAKSSLIPCLLGFSVAFSAACSSFASAEEIADEVVITESNSIIKEISSLPSDGKLTGSLTVTNGTETSYTDFYQTKAIVISGVTETITLENFALSVTSYGLLEGSNYHDIYGISNGVISLTNSSITIDANTGKGATYLYALKDTDVIDFDAESKITLTNDAPGASQVYGIRSGSVKNFAGIVDVDSASEANAVSITDTETYGTQFASTAEISATAVTDAIALRYSASSSEFATAAQLNGTFTAESTSTQGRSAIAASIYADSHNAIVHSINGTYSATALADAIALDVSNDLHIGSIGAGLTITSTTTDYTNDVVAYIGGLGFVGLDSARQSGFGDFTGTITAKGASSAVGMELQHYALMQADGSNVSGIISGSISASTDETYFLTRDESGVIVENQTDFDRSTFHFKSTAAIRIVVDDSAFEKSASMSFNTSAEVSELNFADGAKAEAWVGAEGSPKSYGDVIQFTVDQLILNADSDALVTLNGDITTDAHAYGEGDGSGGGGESEPHSVQNRAAIVTERRVLTFNEGNYNVSSDYWFVSQVDMGNSLTLNTGHVLLTDSTRFVGTDTLNFHVNSAIDYSNIVVSAEEMLTITETNTVNVTLGADIMATDNFEIHLIAGEIVDGISTELLITLTDLILGDGTEEGSLQDDLSSIYIKYNGEKLFYTEGMSIIMDGSSTNLTIGRGDGAGVVPEPSTATLSLLALAGLLARRRRSQKV